jgi:hypothetical protein
MVDGGASIIAPWDVQNKLARELADHTLRFVE